MSIVNSSWLYLNSNYPIILLKQLVDFLKSNIDPTQLKLQTKDLPINDHNSFSTFELKQNNHDTDFAKHDVIHYQDINKCFQSSDFGINEKKMSIVVITNEVCTRNLLIDCLSTTYNCSFINNSRQAYSLISRTIPDIVISDDQLPIMEGFEFFEKIKGTPKVCHIPIILLTDENKPEQIVAGYDKGADICVTKPIKTEVMKAQISRLIKNRELIREKYITQNFMIDISSDYLKRDEKFIIQLRQVLEENLSDSDFNVQVLTTGLNMSNTKLYRKIKLLTGYSPVEFILFFKMQRAFELLSNSDSIKVIGYNLGFKNLSYFSRCFKKQFGVTPFEFRKKGISKIA